MPKDTQWVGNIYHGIGVKEFHPVSNPSDNYIAYLGRIIEPKGLHLAISAVKRFNKTAKVPVALKIAGKHYAEYPKDTYWQKVIKPTLDKNIEYLGFIDNTADKQEFLGNAKALIIPSTFNEPFGMVMIEALACGTPIVGLDSGAIPEVISEGKTGYVVNKGKTKAETVKGLAKVLEKLDSIDRTACRKEFEERFTLARMCQEHKSTYEKILQNN
jgi:glycosyltransferase involved in cell wall biosynthesis